MALAFQSREVAGLRHSKHFRLQRPRRNFPGLNYLMSETDMWRTKYPLDTVAALPDMRCYPYLVSQLGPRAAVEVIFDAVTCRNPEAGVIA